MIGCGKMGSALLSQWVRGPEAITVIDPAQEQVPDGVVLARSAAEISGQTFDCIVAAISYT